MLIVAAGSFAFSFSKNNKVRLPMLAVAVVALAVYP